MKRKGPERDVDKQRFWQGQVARWRQSRQSVRDYCRDNALREPSFYAWRRELGQRGQASKAGNRSRSKASPTARTSPDARQRLLDRRASHRSSLPPTRDPQAAGTAERSPGTPSFLPVRVVEGPAAKAAGGVEIVLPHGRTVRVLAGFDRQTLAEVLAVLEARPC